MSTYEDECKRKYHEEVDIVNRCWSALGISSYEGASGKTIYQHIEALKAKADAAAARPEAEAPRSSMHVQRADAVEVYMDDGSRWLYKGGEMTRLTEPYSSEFMKAVIESVRGILRESGVLCTANADTLDAMQKVCDLALKGLRGEADRSFDQVRDAIFWQDEWAHNLASGRCRMGKFHGAAGAGEGVRVLHISAGGNGQMICELCTIDVVRGTVWRTPAVTSGSASFPSGFVLCGNCHRAVTYARPESVEDLAGNKFVDTITHTCTPNEGMKK